MGPGPQPGAAGARTCAEPSNVSALCGEPAPGGMKKPASLMPWRDGDRWAYCTPICHAVLHP